MTEELINEVCDSLLFIRKAQDLYRGAICRYMFERGLKKLDHAGYTFKLVSHKPEGSPSERRKWRSLYGAAAFDLKIEKTKEAAA